MIALNRTKYLYRKTAETSDTTGNRPLGKDVHAP